jgi:drug/metabolite transporter (DMT)-like permease
LFVGWALSTGGVWNGLGSIELLASVGQGVLSAGAFLGFLAGLRVLGPVRTAITSTIEPFWTTLLGAMLLGQPAGGGTVIGGVAIIIAVVLLQMRRRPVL